MSLIDDTALLAIDVPLFHAIVHGNTAATVATEGGVVPSMARLLASMGAGTIKGAWVTATAYVLGDVVTSSGTAYRCILAHTSAAALATDLAASKWIVHYTATSTVDTMTALKAAGNTYGAMVMLGYNSAGDGGAGIFRWDSASAAADNGGTIIQPAALPATGRWIRVGWSDLTPHHWGAYGDNATNDATALQSAIDYLSSVGGGTLTCLPGKTYKLNTAPIVKDRVILDLNGATLRCTLTATGGADYGPRVRNYAGLINGTINIVSSGVIGSQAGLHAAVNVGPLASDGGTVASPSADEGVTGWQIRNLTLSTDRDGKAVIQVMGGANNGIIENITVPDSATHFIVVAMDWGYLGTINPADIPTSRTSFNGGTAYTTHPNNIVVRNIKAGAQSRAKVGVDTGSHIVRLSAVYNITVENVRAKQCTYAGVRFTAGDCGFEFAQANIKPLAHRGVVFSNVKVENTTDSWLAYCDCYADNVQAAVTGVAYAPLLDPICETDLLLHRVSGVGSGGGSVTDGIRFEYIRGGEARDCSATGYSNGGIFEDSSFQVKFVGGSYYKNRNAGIFGHHANTPTDGLIERVTTYQNGQDAGSSTPFGIYLNKTARFKVIGCIFGHVTPASEVTQTRALRVENNTTNLTVRDNYVRSAKAGGLSVYSFGSGSDFLILDVFANNSAVSSLTGTALYGGSQILPNAMEMGTDGLTRRVFRAKRVDLSSGTTPASGTWALGDTIFYSDPVASDYAGTTCVAAGSPGTWKRFGATTA